MTGALRTRCRRDGGEWDLGCWGRPVSVALLILLSCLTVTAAIAQTDTATPPAPPASTPDPQPIPASEIPARAARANDLIRDAEASASADDRIVQIREALPGEEARVAELEAQTNERLQSSISTSTIKETEKAVLRVRDRLERWINDLSTRSSAVESILRSLQLESSLWELTRDRKPEAELPDALQVQIEETLQSLGKTETDVRGVRDRVLALQAAVSDQQEVLNGILARLEEESSRRTKTILSIDSPPLWDALDDRDDLVDQLAGTLEEQRRDLRTYLSEQGVALLFWFGLWVLFVVELFAIGRTAQAWAVRDESLKSTAAILDQPIAAATIIIAIANNILQPRAPTAWTDTINLLLVLALMGLLPRVIAKPLHRAPYYLVPLFILLRMTSASPAGSLLNRLALLALATVGIASCAWLLRTIRTESDLLRSSWRRFVTIGLRLATLLLLFGVLMNLVGGLRMATLLALGTVDGIFTALVFWVADYVLRAAVRGGLLTNVAARLGIAPDHSDTVRRTASRVITFFATAFFVVFLLKGFFVYDMVVGVLLETLQWKMTVGEFSIAPGDLLIFGITIWLSIKLAALVEFTLDVSVLPRFDMPKGVPQAIASLNRWAVIVVGAIVAATAAGLDIGKATILVGALGVGVGFGLQNVVSNFVSGLILLFERPVRIGDVLELGTRSGKVEEIGMRATILRTWQGADLIVPNADLISSNVLNWTLKSEQRRVEIKVGVGYASDPELVARLLVQIARDHPNVLGTPGPLCLFKALGESSLDFQLRAWVHSPLWETVDSELRFAIVHALRENNIEIPFPQQDLHVRSLPDGSLRRPPADEDQR